MRIPAWRAASLGLGALLTTLSAGHPVRAALAVTLPVEVVGENGSSAQVTVDVPAARARSVRSLWMRIHGLSYAGMVSVQVNGGPWTALDNDTVAVAEPAKSYGGIGGGFATLTVTLPLPSGTVVDGSHTITFRVNKTDGVASGFRVVAFDLVANDGTKTLEPSSFVSDDPARWTPPFADRESIRAGEQLWLSAPLTANGLPNAPPIRAHCSDCHAR